MDDLRIGPWRTGIPAGARPQLEALLAQVREVDGRAPDELPDDRELAVLPATVDGRWVGLAWRSGSDPAELYVDPGHRGRGIGRALAQRVLDAGGIWAHGTLPAAVALAASTGARPIRRLLQLRRPLAEPLPVDLPGGVSIRTFSPGQDEDAFLAVNSRAFAWHPEQGRLDRAGLAAEMGHDWFDADGFFLAVDRSDTVLGFHWTKIHRDVTPPIGEVYVIGVDPRSPIRGLGAPLTAVGLNYLAGRGLDTVMLYVEADNAPALRLYDRYGFTQHAVDTVFALASS